MAATGSTVPLGLRDGGLLPAGLRARFCRVCNNVIIIIIPNNSLIIISIITLYNNKYHKVIPINTHYVHSNVASYPREIIRKSRPSFGTDSSLV